MIVTNVIEKIISQQLDEIWEQDDIYDLKDINKADVLAIVLNSIPPRYATRDQGVAFVKAEYFDAQMQADVVGKIIEAIERVRKHPVR